jgi:hypothetical protein
MTVISLGLPMMRRSVGHCCPSASDDVKVGLKRGKRSTTCLGDRRAASAVA